MKRRIFNFVVGLFIAMEVTLLVIAAVTQNRDLKLLSLSTERSSFDVHANLGMAEFVSESDDCPAGATDSSWSRWGVRYESYRFKVGSFQQIWSVSELYVALLLAIPPFAWLADAWRREQVRKRGLAGFCQVCGYDLRACSGRCSECGAIPAAGQKPIYNL